MFESLYKGAALVASRLHPTGVVGAPFLRAVALDDGSRMAAPLYAENANRFARSCCSCCAFTPLVLAGGLGTRFSGCATAMRVQNRPRCQERLSRRSLMSAAVACFFCSNSRLRIYICYRHTGRQPATLAWGHQFTDYLNPKHSGGE